MTEPSEGDLEIRGLTLRTFDMGQWIDRDIGLIAARSLEALRVAVLAIEQIVTGEKLVKSLDIADFYRELSMAIEEDIGEYAGSDSGDVTDVQAQIQGVIDTIEEANQFVRQKEMPA